MAARVIVRFSEQRNYDINYDADVVRFMATTSSGSFWADVMLEGERGLRKDREAFKNTVVELIQAGAAPGYIELDAGEQ